LTIRVSTVTPETGGNIFKRYYSIFLSGYKEQMKPVIGITTALIQGAKKMYATVSNNYVHSVERAGGIPLLLPIVAAPETRERYLSLIDGLLVTGGDEGVNPQLYGENPVRQLECICPERDQSEVHLINESMQRNIPTLGICRGMQTMNVACGGSLYQDIFTQVDASLGHLPKNMPVDSVYHAVTFEEGSKLESIFSTNRLMINSFHHQAVKDVAASFTVTARSDDGIIEAIEHQNHPFAIGVQWHPEDLTLKHSHFLELFSALVRASNTL